VKNGRPPNHTDRARELASELRDTEWDEPSSITILDGAGRKVRVRAPSHSEIELAPASEDPVTRPDNPRLPSSAPAPAKGVAVVLRHVSTWKHVAALAVIAALLAFAMSKGISLW
jgi:hypothetical protein